VALILQTCAIATLTLTKAPTQQLFNHLCIADARQHVGDRITHTHFAVLYCLPACFDDARDITSENQLTDFGASQANDGTYRVDDR
jgi:hypothetical protein